MLCKVKLCKYNCARASASTVCKGKYKCKFISISDASTWLPKKGKLKIDGKSVWCGTENEEGEDEDGDEDGVRIRKRRIL